MQHTQRSTQAKTRRIRRVRAKIFGTAERPRMAIRRSLAHIYAQLIDDRSGRTFVAASDADVKTAKLRKAEVAHAVGDVLATRALAIGITVAVCDRRDKKYHGRIKSLVDGARLAGLRV